MTHNKIVVGFNPDECTFSGSYERKKKKIKAEIRRSEATDKYTCRDHGNNAERRRGHRR